MAKLEITSEKRKKYAEWIKNVRRKNNLEQQAFAEMVLRFDQTQEGEICSRFHRNSVGSWERGQHLPINIETFVSIALIELSGDTKEKDIPVERRRERLMIVQERMKEYLGKRLYARNLSDALLIQAIRGIYSLEELPLVREKMNEIIRNTHMSEEDCKAYSLERATSRISLGLAEVTKKVEFEEFVKNQKYYFYVGGRTVGDRLRECFEKKQQELYKLNLREAIVVYAPKYRDSYNRIFSSDICVSRRWLLEFCIHLRFEREEMNQMLENAGMLALSEENDEEEYDLRSLSGIPIGSVNWYRHMKEKGSLQYRYEACKELKISEKLAYCLLIACWLNEKKSVQDFYPVDYLLEYFPENIKGRKVLQNIIRDIRKKHTQLLDNPQGCLENKIYDFEELFEDIEAEISVGSKAMRTAYADYCKEFQMYNLNDESDFTAKKLYYFAAISYSIFSGTIYEGKIMQEDLEFLQESLGEDLYAIYLFFNVLWNSFLNKRKLYKDDFGGIYAKNNQNKTTKSFHMENIIEDCFESVLLAENLL